MRKTGPYIPAPVGVLRVERHGKGGEEVRGKRLIVIALMAVVLMVAAGVAVAASTAAGDKGDGCARGLKRSRVLSETRVGEAGGLTIRNQGEGDRVRTEHCDHEMSGECAGECQRAMERERERLENEGSVQECPCQDGECPMYRNGATDDAEGAGDGAGFSQPDASGGEAARKGDCDMQQDRLRTRDRSCTT